MREGENGERLDEEEEEYFDVLKLTNKFMGGGQI
jgi:hypothetical protein